MQLFQLVVKRNSVGPGGDLIQCECSGGFNRNAAGRTGRHRACLPEPGDDTVPEISGARLA